MFNSSQLPQDQIIRQQCKYPKGWLEGWEHKKPITHIREGNPITQELMELDRRTSMTPHYKMKEDMTRTRTKPVQNRHLTKTLCGSDKGYVFLFVVVSRFFFFNNPKLL